MSTQNIITSSARTSSTPRRRQTRKPTNISKSLASVPSKAERDASKVSSLGENKEGKEGWMGGLPRRQRLPQAEASAPMQISLTGVTGKRVALMVLCDGASSWGSFPRGGGGYSGREVEEEDPERLGVLSHAKAYADIVDAERKEWVSFLASLQAMRESDTAEDFEEEAAYVEQTAAGLPDDIIYDPEVAIWPSAEMTNFYHLAKQFEATPGRVWSVVADSRIRVERHLFEKRMERKRRAEAGADAKPRKRRR